MNERIRELAEQCHHRYSEHNIDLEKFAKLIAQDCISKIARIGISNYENDDIMWAIEFATEIISARYGVKNENTNSDSQG
jgi:hypothetical protein